jgi:hypothetical protein
MASFTIEIDSESVEHAKQQILEIWELAEKVDKLISKSWLLRLIFGMKIKHG